MIKASIVGATGYTGAVLTDILAEHPEVRLQALTSKSYVGRQVAEVFPHLRVEGDLRASTPPEAVAGSDVAFVCYPHAEAHPVVAELVDAGCRVVDLSADFRLKDPAAYPEWYGFEHPRPDLVAEAVFGLPEMYRDEVATARAWWPTRAAIRRRCCWACCRGRRDRRRRASSSTRSRECPGPGGRPRRRRTSARCTATSGPTARSGTGTRRRWSRNSALAAGNAVPVSFTPHLLPVDRGILSTTLYFRPRGGLIGTRGLARQVPRLLCRASRSWRSATHMPSLAEVVGTNFCRLTVREDAQRGRGEGLRASSTTWSREPRVRPCRT